ncbi:hypothetical protein [Arthrobacter sp. UYCo732]
MTYDRCGFGRSDKPMKVYNYGTLTDADRGQPRRSNDPGRSREDDR